MKENVYLGLGSNVGNRAGFLKKTAEKISEHKNIKLIRSSSMYETEPWGITDQEKFLNSVIEIETGLMPSELLDFLKATEKSVGRTKRGKWLEREIDIDILFFGDLVYQSGVLTVPHKEVQNRRFVLVPMNEIAPDFVHPVLLKPMKKLLALTRDKSKVKIFKNKK